MLRQAIEYAEASDFENLCGMTIAESGCTDLIDQVGELPEGRPVTVESRVSEARDGFVASHILGVCVGDRYTEVMVVRVRDTGSLEFVSPVYWSGYRVLEAELDEDGNPTATLAADSAPNPCN